MSKLILKVTVEHITDLDQNISNLSTKRLEAYNRGDFEFIGISAKATIDIDYNTHYTRLAFMEITSGGIWGIESDDADNIGINENEQLEELKDLVQKYVLIPKDEIHNAFNIHNINHKEVAY